MSSSRKSANLTIDAQLVDEAKALKVNLSRAAQDGIARAVAKEKAKQWQEENAEAIQSSNEYVEKYGLPLEKYRLF